MSDTEACEECPYSYLVADYDGADGTHSITRECSLPACALDDDEREA